MAKDENKPKRPEAAALGILGRHRFAPVLRAAIQFVAFALLLYGGFLVNFVPPEPVRNIALGLLAFDALLITLVVQLFAAAHPWWERSLWWIVSASMMLLVAFTYAYSSAALRHVVQKPSTEEYVIIGETLLDPAKCQAAGDEDDIGTCVENNKGTFTLYGRQQILDAQEKLLFRYLMFGLSLLFSLVAVLEALVWARARQPGAAP